MKRLPKLISILLGASICVGAAGPVRAAPGSGDEGELIDEVVAVVNQHVITRSEVWDEAQLILVERRGQAALDRRVTPAFLKQVLDMLINQQVLLDEARRIGLPPLGEPEKEALREGFRRRFVDREAYVRFLLTKGMTEASVSDALERHLRVRRLREKKLRVMPEVTDREVQQYYQDKRMDFGTAPLSQVSEAIRRHLLDERSHRELVRWIGELRKRSEVKVLVDLLAESGAESGG